MKRLLFLFLVAMAILINFMNYQCSLNEIEREARVKKEIINGR